MSHSGSYVSTSNRTTSSIAVSTDEPAAHYGGVKSILRRKKTWEHTAIKAAKLKQEERLAKANDAGARERDEADKLAHEAATAKAKEIRNELNKLFLQQTEIEKSVQHEWKRKIEEFEQRSLKEEQEKLQKLREEQKAEMKELIEKVRIENEIDHKKKAEAIAALKKESSRGDTSSGGSSHKRKADSQEECAESSKKRKVEGGGESSNIESSKNDDANDATTSADKSGDENKSDASKNPEGGGDDVAEEKESVKKGRELQKIVEEMNDLNKTKSQMIWLLKQVITAEAKQKLNR